MAGTLNPGRRRVLLLVDALDDRVGGGERTVVTLATHLPPDRYEVWVATGRNAGGEPIRRLAEAGIRHVHLARRGRIGPRGLARLVRLLRRERFDVLHPHKYGSNIWGALTGRLARVPVVVAHEHSWPYAGQPVRRVLDHLIGRASDAFVAVSETDRRLMISFEKVPERKTRVIPSAWVPSGGEGAGDLRAELGIAPGAPVVGTVAVMRPVKRLELLVEAFGRVAAEIPEARLVMAGDGDVRPGLERQAQELGLAGRVHFLGMRQDVGRVWNTLDVGVISSEREGSPVAAMEAMAAGVPLVATAVGGMAEVVEPGVSGLLVESGDAAAIAAAVLELLRDPARHEGMRAAARGRAQQFTAARHAERVAALYDELLASKGR